MSITDSDYGTPAVLTPMVMTDTLNTLFTSIISNINVGTVKATAISDQTEAKLNEVIGVVNTLQSGSEINITELQDNVNAIIALEAGTDNESFLSVMTKLAAELDRRAETDAFRVNVTASPNGVQIIDLTAYGFTSADDYKLIVKVVNAAGKHLTATANNYTPTACNVTIRDEDVFQDASIDTSYYNAGALGAIELVVIVVHTATPVGLTIDASAFNVATITPVIPDVESVSISSDALDAFILLDIGSVGITGNVVSEAYALDGKPIINTFTANAIVSDTTVTVAHPLPDLVDSATLRIYEEYNSKNYDEYTFSTSPHLPDVPVTALAHTATVLGVSFRVTHVVRRDDFGTYQFFGDATESGSVTATIVSDDGSSLSVHPESNTFSVSASSTEVFFMSVLIPELDNFNKVSIVQNGITQVFKIDGTLLTAYTVM